MTEERAFSGFIGGILRRRNRKTWLSEKKDQIGVFKVSEYHQQQHKKMEEVWVSVAIKRERERNREREK